MAPAVTAGRELTAQARVLRRIRWTLAAFIFGLVISGVTAFPLLHELNWLAEATHAEKLAVNGGTFAEMAAWIVRVRDGLRTTYAAYPFVAYGTDWLAFGHLVIALFFLGPMVDPARNVFVLRTGLWACGLVWPLALICGPVRGIPVYWRLIDCSFGVSGFPLLWYCLRLTRQLPAWERVTIPSDGR